MGAVDSEPEEVLEQVVAVEAAASLPDLDEPGQTDSGAAAISIVRVVW